MRGNIGRQRERLVGEALGEYEEHRLKGEYRKSRKKETGKRTQSKSKEKSEDKGRREKYRLIVIRQCRH